MLRIILLLFHTFVFGCHTSHGAYIPPVFVFPSLVTIRAGHFGNLHNGDIRTTYDFVSGHCLTSFGHPLAWVKKVAVNIVPAMIIPYKIFFIFQSYHTFLI